MGWASAPYDPYWAARHPKRAALMAAAGPLGNFMLALLAFSEAKAPPPAVPPGPDPDPDPAVPS
jgi:hypothetical protein